MSWRARFFPIPGMMKLVLAITAILVGTFAAQAADIGNGSRLYAMHCATCHGPNGVPTMPGTPDLKRGQVMLRPDVQLLRSIRSGRGGMPAYFGVLSEREILDLVAYMRTLL